MISAEIGRETTTYSPIATKNVSAIAPTETTYDWSSNVSWTVSYTAWTNWMEFRHQSADLHILINDQVPRHVIKIIS